MLNRKVVKHFKRNPEAQLCHQVLQECFAQGERMRAEAYAKSKNATVRVVMREEYDNLIEIKK